MHASQLPPRSARKFRIYQQALEKFTDFATFLDVVNRKTTQARAGPVGAILPVSMLPPRASGDEFLSPPRLWGTRTFMSMICLQSELQDTRIPALYICRAYENPDQRA